MSVYDRLASHLTKLAADEWNPTFADIENVLKRSLPASARIHRSWWGNCQKGTHSQAKGWIPVGWEVDPRCIDLRGQTVRFVRKDEASRKLETASLQRLREQAMRFSGISDRGELEEAALKMLISHHAASALADLGGSDPNAWVPGRRRFE